MRLVLDPDLGIYSVRSYAPGEIVIGNQTLHRACIVSATCLIPDWAATSPSDLDEAALAPLLELRPTIVLIGLLESHAPPPRAIVIALQRRGIGLESMNLGAACRTYNVLASEGRAVAAGLFPV